MFKCDDCNAYFDEPDITEDHHPYGMRYAVEYWAVCPLCHSANFEYVSLNEKDDFTWNQVIWFGGR